MSESLRTPVTYVNPGSVIGTSVTFIVLGTIVIVGRFYVRRLKHNSFELDDWFAVPAWVRNTRYLESPVNKTIVSHRLFLYRCDCGQVLGSHLAGLQPAHRSLHVE